MSYISKRRAVGPKWISLGAALRHISRLPGKLDAFHELRTALLDGELKARFCPLSKETDRRVYRLPNIFEDVPPRFWRDCMIFPIGRGYVVQTKIYAAPLADDYTDLPPRRGVVVDHDDLLNIWPLRAGNRTPVVPLKDEVNALATAQVSPILKLRSASEAEITKLLKKIYDDARKSPPNIDTAFAVLNRILKADQKKAPRITVRHILKMPEFSQRRRAPGRPRK